MDKTRIYLQILLVDLWNFQSLAVDVSISFAGDFGGNYNEYPMNSGKKIGGVARMKKYLDDNARDDKFIYVGNIMDNQTHHKREQAETAQQILKSLGATTVVLGRNEFTMKPDDFEWFRNTTKNLIVGANTDHKYEHVPQYTVLDVGGSSIGVVGYISEDVATLPAARDFNVSDIIQSINDKTVQMRHHKLIIAAGCTGIELAKEIAKGTSSVDVVLSSCSSNLLWNSQEKPPENIVKYDTYPLFVKNLYGKDVILAHSYGSTKFLGRLKLMLDDVKGGIQGHEGQMIYMEGTMESEPKLLKLRSGENNTSDLKTGEAGKSNILLDGVCGKSECNLGNIIADAFIQYKCNKFKGKYWTDTPIALVAAGNIKASINSSASGNIPAEQLNKAMPNKYDLVTLDIKGKYLMKVMEYSLDLRNAMAADKYLQLSGLRVLYDSRRSKGNKIVTVKARCSECSVPKYEDVKDGKIYKVITTKNLLDGDFGHTILANKSFNVVKETTTNQDVVLEYIKHIRIMAMGNTDRICQQPRLSGNAWKFSEGVNYRLLILNLMILNYLCI